MDVRKIITVDHLIGFQQGERRGWPIEVFSTMYEAEVVALHFQTVDDVIEKAPVLTLMYTSKVDRREITSDFVAVATEEQWSAIPAWLREIFVQQAPSTFSAEGVLDDARPAAKAGR